MRRDIRKGISNTAIMYNFHEYTVRFRILRTSVLIIELLRSDSVKSIVEVRVQGHNHLEHCEIREGRACLAKFENTWGKLSISQ